ncbi:hypothetical protein VNO80_21070 [Phaseolus coccineus]|uniref:Large ribosomal subunit protein uL6 alpha-beta domain-containing protein n=1 Tax=Phaseolus coccineus TaxID=3886 RepID=A0AAN9QSY0_PHACN
MQDTVLTTVQTKCCIELPSTSISAPAWSSNAVQKDRDICDSYFTFRISTAAKIFRFLKIVGVGYKARAKAAGSLLYLKLGYSHEVELGVSPAVRVFCFKNNVICCNGIDKQRVHQFAATIRSCKPPEVYNGKGIMYVDEVINKGHNQSDVP